MRLFLLTLLVSAAFARTASAADADRGGDLFDENCAECHSVASTGHNKKGPSLYKVFGRRAATQAGFVYSPSLTATGLTWSAQTLDAYLANPKKVAPEGKMKFDGFASPSDRADVIAFLRQAQ